MKLFPRSASLAAMRTLFLFGAMVGWAISPQAAELKEARVTLVVKDVKLLPTGAVPRLATVSDEVRDGTAVRTGMDSRSELKFADQTLARLGANTIFSFAEGTRSLDLQDGVILLRVPKGSGGARINSSAVTAAITGTTVMVETHSLTKKNKNPYYKFIVLEGTARLYQPGHLGESVLVKAGQMIIMRLDSKTIPEPVDVDIQKIMQSSLLITGFGPLGSEKLIAYQEVKQNQQKSSGQLFETNLVIYGGGTNLVLADPNVVDLAVAAQKNATPTPIPTPTPTPAPTPPPTPSKFGPPTTITSPAPYVITGGTTITTDPAITTNGMTDFGKIYRGPAEDGPLPTYLFGSTSAFDTAIKFQPGPNDLPIAVFKFQSLSLIGNPTIDLSNGGVTKLGLVAADGITSGPPGGTLTFSGLDLLGLITQAGSINLTSDVSFQNIAFLFIYARGAGSNLTLASPILGSDRVELNAEGSMQLMIGITAAERLKFLAGGDLVTTGPGGSAEFEVDNIGGTIAGTTGDRGNITLGVGGNLSSQSLSLLIANNDGGHISGDANISATVGGSVSTQALSATTDNTGGQIGNDASITITSSGSVAAQGDATIQILNSDNGSGGSAGQIGGNATIDVTTGGDFTATSLFGFINDRHAGSIGGAATLGLDVGGALTTTNDFTWGISTRNDGSGGGTIGSNTGVTVNAASVSIGGFFDTFISTAGGGTITGSASNLVNVTGDLIVQGPVLVEILATGFNQINPINFIAGGHIGGDATVTLSARNITTSSTASGTPGTDTMALEASIYPNGSGTIGGNATVNVLALQNITAPGTAFFTVANGNFMSTGGGTIGGNADLNVSASNIATGDLFAQIFNYGGASIGGNAEVNVTATNLTVNGSLDSTIDNTNGNIGGNAALNYSVSGAGTVTIDAMFQIFGSNGAKTAAININGGNYTAGGTFLGNIDGDGTITLNNASISADTIKVGAFGTNGTLRIGGGTISANTLLHLYAPGSNGIVDFVSNVTLTSSGSVPAIAANTVTIENGVVVTIGGSTPANVFANVPNYSARSGGNNSTSGRFAGAGATTQPLGGQPPFDSPTSRVATSSTRTKTPTIHVTDSSQLGTLLNNAAPGRDGKVRIVADTRSRNTSAQGAMRTIPLATALHRATDARGKLGMFALRSP